MCATLPPPPPPTTSSSLYHSPLLFTLSLTVLSNSSKPRAVLKSFPQTLQISFIIPLSLAFFLLAHFLSPNKSRKQAENWWNPKMLLPSRSFAFATFFTFLFFFFDLLLSLLVLLNCKTYFGHWPFLLLIFFACLLLLLLLCFVCVPLSEIPLAAVLPTPPLPFFYYYTVSVFQVNLQVTLSDLGIILLYKVYRQSQPEALLSVRVCACL